jgi:hypothetical protein
MRSGSGEDATRRFALFEGEVNTLQNRDVNEMGLTFSKEKREKQ